MSIRARFRVQSVKKLAGETTIIELSAVMGATGDNVSWSKYTPSGALTLTVTNPDAAALFEGRLGKDYYLDFTPAE